MNKFLLVHRGQTGGDLGRHVQGQPYLKPAGASDESLERLSLHKLHRVKIVRAGSPQVEDRGNVRMADAGRRARFTQETKSSRLVTQVAFADDLQRHRTLQIDVERLVSNPHRAATQFDRISILVGHQFVVLEPIGCARGFCLSAVRIRRLIGFATSIESPAKQAHRTEFHGAGKLVPATRTDASALHCRTMVAFH